MLKAGVRQRQYYDTAQHCNAPWFSLLYLINPVVRLPHNGTYCVFPFTAAPHVKVFAAGSACEPFRPLRLFASLGMTPGVRGGAVAVLRKGASWKAEGGRCS